MRWKSERTRSMARLFARPYPTLPWPASTSTGPAAAGHEASARVTSLRVSGGPLSITMSRASESSPALRATSMAAASDVSARAKSACSVR